MRIRTRSGDEPFDEDARSRHAADIDDIRAKIAAIVKIVFTVLAVILALGALFVACNSFLRPSNFLVSAVYHLADTFDGPFSRSNGVFSFSGTHAYRWDGIVNWGFGAIIYLVIANLLHAVIRPKGLRSTK